MECNALLVLAHLMDKCGKLDRESQDRADKALELYRSGGFDMVCTSGWAYRDDTDLAIADAISDYLRSAAEGEINIYADRRARDTVGDAFFVRQNLGRLKNVELTVITSDYHVLRTQVIFNAILKRVRVIGVPSSQSTNDYVLAHEQESLQAFFRTFEGVDFGDFGQVEYALYKRHPLYFDYASGELGTN